MTKKEAIWGEILTQAFDEKKIEFTQKGLAEKLGVSTSTVFNALKIPRQSGAVVVSGRNFAVLDAEKFLYLFATQRNLKKNIIYKTSVSESPRSIEGKMSAAAVFAAYSAYTKKYGDAPADYGKVYVYADEKTLEEIKKRFPPRKGATNLFVLKPGLRFSKKTGVTSGVETFADLWNLEDWYAKDFLEALKKKIFKSQ